MTNKKKQKNVDAFAGRKAANKQENVHIPFPNLFFSFDLCAYFVLGFLFFPLFSVPHTLPMDLPAVCSTI